MPAVAQFAANRYTLLLDDSSVAARFQSRAEMQSAAAAPYRAQIEARQQAVLGQLAARNIPVTGRTSTLLNAIYVIAPASRVSEMLAIPGVAGIRPMRQFQMLLNKATQLMNASGASGAWNALGGQGSAGQGMKIAIIDTGIDQTHPAFQDSSLTVPNGFPKCTKGHPEDCAFTNSKVIVARSYVRQLAGYSSSTANSPSCGVTLTCSDDTSVQPNPATSQPDDYSPRDHIGHGTATASAAAGNQNSGVVTFTGMAPKAYLGNYKIFGSPGVNEAPTDDVMIMAIEDALNDGMDIASLSVGAQALGGALDTGAACGVAAGLPCDPVAYAYDAAVGKGLVVVAAAGNSGSDAILSYGQNYPYFNSISSPSNAPHVISVGATTSSHVLTPAVSVNASSAPANVKGLAAQLGTSIFYPSAQGANSGPLVDITQLGDNGFACAPLPGYSLIGAYALIERSPAAGTGTQAQTCTFATKAINAANAGALGIVFYMADASAPINPGGLDSSGANFIGPSAMISNSDGLALKSYIDTNPGQAVTIDVAGQEVALTTYDSQFIPPLTIAPNQVASYSSFGPAPEGTIKPDIVATGGVDVDIITAPGMYLAAQSSDPTGFLYSVNRYAAADGTSFATPLVAGAAALVKQAHPSYSPAQIKSALVNSAAQDTTTDDGHSDSSGNLLSPMNVNAQWLGGGRLDAGAALNATIAADPATISFGYLRAGALPVKETSTITNKGTTPVAIAVQSSTLPPGITVAADQSSVAAGASVAVNFTLSGTIPAPGSYSGTVTLTAGSLTERVPYLFIVPDGVPHNVIPITGAIQGTIGQDVGAVAIQITDTYGVPVTGSPVTFAVNTAGGVTFRSVQGAPNCSAENTSPVTCNTDNYGIAYADIVLGGAAGHPTVTATATNAPNNPPLQLTAYILAQPKLTAGQVIDNAAYQPTIAPGSIAAVKGTNLMDPDLLVNTAAGYDLNPTAVTYFPLMLDGVNVSFDVPGTGISVPAPIVAVSANQINFQVPWELKGQTAAKVKVIVDETFGLPIYSTVVDAAVSDYTPAFFTNSGNVADAEDVNYHVITASNPATRGQIISLYANGLGPVANPPADGLPAGTTSTTTTPCVVSIGGQVVPANQVQFCGLAPGYAIYQINVQVPTNIPAGNQAITISIGGKTSPTGIVIPVQ